MESDRGVAFSCNIGCAFALIINGARALFIVCPPTANTTVKIAHGIADSLISNCVSQALKANQKVYIYRVYQKPGTITRILPDGNKLTLTIRKFDLINVETLETMTGVTVLSNPQDIEKAIEKTIHNATVTHSSCKPL